MCKEHDLHNLYTVLKNEVVSIDIHVHVTDYIVDQRWLSMMCTCTYGIKFSSYGVWLCELNKPQD